MNSETAAAAARTILGQLANALAEATLLKRIDEPIQTALLEFSYPPPAERPTARFHRAAAEFAGQARARILAKGLASIQTEGLGDALALIEHDYRGTYADGYDGALQDALDTSHAGLPVVLGRMAEALKTRYRESYLRWFLARQMRLAPWETKCALTALLLEACQEGLPPELRLGSPEQWVDCLPDLIQLYLRLAGPIPLAPAAWFTW